MGIINAGGITNCQFSLVDIHALHNFPWGTVPLGGYRTFRAFHLSFAQRRRVVQEVPYVGYVHIPHNKYIHGGLGQYRPVIPGKPLRGQPGKVPGVPVPVPAEGLSLGCFFITPVD